MSTLHLIHGLPGSGKTTYARKLARETGAVLLNHDELRVALFGLTPSNDTFSSYTDAITEYLWRVTGEFSSRGIDVILDHGFWTRSSRDDARVRGQALGCKVIFYSMRCPDSVADARVLARNESGKHYAIPPGALPVFREKFEALGHDEPHLTIEST